MPTRAPRGRRLTADVPALLNDAICHARETMAALARPGDEGATRWRRLKSPGSLARRAFPSHGRGRRFNPYSAHHLIVCDERLTG